MAYFSEVPLHCTVLAALLKFDAFTWEAFPFCNILWNCDALMLLLLPKAGGGEGSLGLFYCESKVQGIRKRKYREKMSCLEIKSKVRRGEVFIVHHILGGWIAYVDHYSIVM
jgi:hypothetical protein